MPRKPRSRGHLTQRYGAYVFRTKDPVIDELRTITQREYGDLSHKSLRQIEERGGPSASAQKAWYFGKTRNPKNATIEAAGRAQGMKRVWVTHRPNR